MDNQLAQSSVWRGRLAVIIMTVVVITSVGILGIYWQGVSDPYAQEVLSLNGNPQNGLAIFQINCGACHNLQAEKNVGPRLDNISKRKSPREIITQVTSGKTPPMPKFQPTEQEMADLLSYLNKL